MSFEKKRVSRPAIYSYVEGIQLRFWDVKVFLVFRYFGVFRNCMRIRYVVLTFMLQTK